MRNIIGPGSLEGRYCFWDCHRWEST